MSAETFLFSICHDDFRVGERFYPRCLMVHYHFESAIGVFDGFQLVLNHQRYSYAKENELPAYCLLRVPNALIRRSCPNTSLGSIAINRSRCKKARANALILLYFIVDRFNRGLLSSKYSSMAFNVPLKVMLQWSDGLFISSPSSWIHHL